MREKLDRIALALEKEGIRFLRDSEDLKPNSKPQGLNRRPSDYRFC